MHGELQCRIAILHVALFTQHTRWTTSSRGCYRHWSRLCLRCLWLCCACVPKAMTQPNFTHMPVTSDPSWSLSLYCSALWRLCLCSHGVQAHLRSHSVLQRGAAETFP